MRIETTAAALAQAAVWADQAVRASTHGVAIEAVDGRITVTGSDGEASIVATLAGDVLVAGSAVVAGKPLAAYCASLPGATPIVVDTGGGSTRSHLHVRGERRVYRFTLFDDRYSHGIHPAADGAVVDAAALPQLLAAVRHAVDPRTALVKLVADAGSLRLYATDSYRLAMAAHDLTTDAELSVSVLVPVAGLATALRHGPTTCTVDARGRVLTLASDHVATTLRLGVAAFPAVETVVDHAQPHRAVLDGDVLGRALQRLGAVAGNDPIRCEIADGTLSLHAQSADGAGTETVAVDGGASIGFGIAIRNLADALHACGGSTVELSYGSARHPLRLSGVVAGSRVVCVIMPIVWDGRVDGSSSDGSSTDATH